MLLNVKITSLALIFFILAGISCSRKDDTKQIRNLIGKGAELAQEHKIDDLLKLTTDDFAVSPGDYDARTIRGLLQAASRTYGNFTIHYPMPSVEVAEDALSAKARLYFVVVNQDKTIPGLKELYDDPQQWIEAAREKAELHQLNLDLVKMDGAWRVKKAQTQDSKGLDFLFESAK